jgi:hypothetical protein
MGVSCRSVPIGLALIESVRARPRNPRAAVRRWINQPASLRLHLRADSGRLRSPETAKTAAIEVEIAFAYTLGNMHNI